MNSLDFRSLKNMAIEIKGSEDTQDLTLVFDEQSWYTILSEVEKVQPRLVLPSPPRHITGYNFWGEPTYSYDYADPLYRESLVSYNQRLNRHLTTDMNAKQLILFTAQGPFRLKVKE